ncbi:MAG TPA: response regulator [Opitutaceae bacterium]|nr:response regulator [Opitutaceae bacterium]
MARPDENPAAPPVNPPASILLVDDEVRNLDVLESILTSPDYHLVRARTAEQALLLLLEGEFAVIVLDIQMPEMSGLELANLIKQRKRTQYIPIIFLTAYYQDDKDVLEGYSTGAVDYLTKPVNPQIFRSKIDVFVDLFRKNRALTATNLALETEIRQRQLAEEALRQVNTDLERRVQERTADLSRANEDLRAHESALRESEAQAMAASRAKDDFLAALSHELRTPLNPVLLLATEAAKNPQLPEEVRADFDTIAKNVALEARLIDDMLDLTRIARGKLTLDMRPSDIHVCLQDALAMVNDEIDQKEIDLTLKLHAPRRVVFGDDVRLKQVFWNVIKNAAKFTDPRGRIVIETSVPAGGGELSVRVTDTGIGMTPPELDRVFDAFSQGDHAAHSSSHRFGGLGLGLAISRMMVEMHSGTISAASEGRNRGTTFVVTLPLLDADAVPRPAESAPPAAAPSPGPNGQARRVLLVEDHKPTSLALLHLLTRRNYTVMAAGSLAEARALAGRETFDLLISDIGLPDGSGCELMAELQGSRGLIGIALTGYGMEEDISRSQAAGFATHLTKPISVQALDRALAAAELRQLA